MYFAVSYDDITRSDFDLTVVSAPETFQDRLAALGANPVTVSSAEIILAIQTEIVDIAIVDAATRARIYEELGAEPNYYRAGPDLALTRVTGDLGFDTYRDRSEAERPLVLRGGDGDDFIETGSGDDFITGGNGGDVLIGGEGNNEIYAGPGDTGNDYITGGPGNDILGGGAGNDSLIGYGASTIFGGAGDDYIADQSTVEHGSTVWAGTGDDTIRSRGWGNDVIGGGPGDDEIHFSAGDDTIYGGADDGNDYIYTTSNRGENTIFAGAGNDTIKTVGDFDTVFNGAGDDEVDIRSGIAWGGPGDDVFSSSSLKDVTYAFTTGNGRDTIETYNARYDTIRIHDAADGMDDLDIAYAPSEEFNTGRTATVSFADTEIVISYLGDGQSLSADDFLFT